MMLFMMGGWIRRGFSAVLEGSRGFLRLLAGDEQRGVQVVQAEQLAEPHLARSGLAVLVRRHGHGGQLRAGQADEVVEVDLEFGLRLPALDADGLVAQDLGVALGGLAARGGVLVDAQGTPGLLGGLGLEH